MVTVKGWFTADRIAAVYMRKPEFTPEIDVENSVKPAEQLRRPPATERSTRGPRYLKSACGCKTRSEFVG